MDVLLKHLLVPDSRGILVPASSLDEGSVYPATTVGEPLERTADRRDTPAFTQSKKRKPSSVGKMETEQSRLSPSAQLHGSEASRFADFTGGILGPDLQSIEDFESESPFQPKVKIVPVKGAKVNPESAVAFHNACQKLGYVVSFNIWEASPYCFSGKVEVGSVVVEEPGPFRSKKEAKDELCRRALPLVQALPPSSKKRKSVDATSGGAETEHLYSENWIGTLQDYVQRYCLGTKPDYHEFMTEQPPHKFACTVTFPSAPPTGFGSETELYHNKAEARKAAAREAVLCLCSQGKIVTTSPAVRPGEDKSIKKAKLANARRAPDPGSTGLPQLIRDVDVNLPENVSLAQQVHNLVAFLGFSQPTWETIQCEAPQGGVGRDQSLGGFVTMAACFPQRDVESELRLAGLLGKVENVYGKKKAKELCCREVIRVLEGIRRDRMA